MIIWKIENWLGPTPVHVQYKHLCNDWIYTLYTLTTLITVIPSHYGCCMGFYCVISQVDEQREDFGNIPPAQRKAKLLKKIDEIRSKIAHETAERLVI